MLSVKKPLKGEIKEKRQEKISGNLWNVKISFEVRGTFWRTNLESSECEFTRRNIKK